MTDQTTAAPSGASAHREAAVELEDLLRHLDGDGTTDPTIYEVVLPGRDNTRRYRGHVPTLRLARTALRNQQRRIDATRSALAVQGPTDVTTADVEAVARFAQNVAGLEPNARTVGGIDFALAELSPTALAAILRAGLASVVGEASALSIDDEAAPEPARAEVPAPSARPAESGPVVPDADDFPTLTAGDIDPDHVVQESLDSLAFHLEGYQTGLWRDRARFPYVALFPARDSSSWYRGVDVPGPAWISSSALASILRAFTAPAANAAEPAPQATMGSVYGELVLGNPVHAAVARALAGADGAVTDAADLVRAVTVAVLDEAANHVRAALREPRVTPLLVIDPDHTVWTEDSVVGMANRYRRTVADAAADELRILARLDSPRP